MSINGYHRFLIGVCGICLLTARAPLGNEPGDTPPREKRFPPLKVPEGFQATLFASDPMIEYPSVIAPGPRPGSLFMAVDYLTGLGTTVERHDEVRLVEDTDGDGRADRATVFATGLNCIQGLAYHGGVLYVMHAPYLSALRDTRGAGKADERKDLLVGLGLSPEEDQIRLHNANGVVPGHDGWLYLAMGDRGCDVERPEGDRLVLHGGGILRCRPDGRDLHVFSTGLRNIYDVALDEDLNVFTRDNENDGGEYKIRVCHSFFGADHGYPYLYYERSEEALAPLADLGLGSSAGGVCYLETQFPQEYRGNLLFCEWGRSVVRFPLRRAKSSFEKESETDFAAGDSTDPYGFKPTDLVVDRDGSLFISDWCDGQRPRRGRGRIYLVRYVGEKKEPAGPGEGIELPTRVDGLIAMLDSESHSRRWRAQEAIERLGQDGVKAVLVSLEKGKLGVRGRLHAVWVLAHVEGKSAIERLLALVKDDPSARVQAQAVRAVADLADPVLARHRLEAGPGDMALSQRLASLATGRDVLVQLEVIIALGRLRWGEAPGWLNKHLKQDDSTLAHAAQWTIRQARNWPAVLQLLDEPGTSAFRPIALRAVAEQFDQTLVDGLIERLGREKGAARRFAYADVLTRVHGKPAPWTYWGFRPGPRPANPVDWERTEQIEEALDRVLVKSDRAGRLAILRRMVREKVPARAGTVEKWLADEEDADTVHVLLTALGGRPGGETRALFERVLTDRKQTGGNRLLATTHFIEGLDEDGLARLSTAARKVEDGPILAELLRAIGTRKAPGAGQLLLSKLPSKDMNVRIAALGAIAELRVSEAGEAVVKLLEDEDPRIRSVAALAAGRLALRAAADRLLKLARDAAPEVRRASLQALQHLREPRALATALEALGDIETTIAALEFIAVLGGPEHAPQIAGATRRQPSAEVLATAGRVLLRWIDTDGVSPSDRKNIERGLAEIHGSTGILLGWRVLGPFQGENADLVKKLLAGEAGPAESHLVQANSADARVRLDPVEGRPSWLACSEVVSEESAKVDFFIASSAPSTIWINGKVVYQRDRAGVPGPYPERFEAVLNKGANRVVIQLTGVKTQGEFALRFRRMGTSAQRERLARAALSRAGNPGAGRKIFLNAEKSQCIKCHRVDNQGEKVGPELTGLGSRFSKVYIVESILEPGRTVSPSFETVLVALKNGKSVVGVKVAETDASLTLVDSQTNKHTIARSDIEEQTRQPISAMPDDLEKRLSEDEFVDLVSFLVNLKERR